MFARPILKELKLQVLRLAKGVGLAALVLASQWRRRRLPILCYHGLSLADEHLCLPGVFMPADMFRRRMQLLRDLRIQVLPLGEALERLYAGTLPERGAAITMDDGFYGSYALARPILREFSFPVTVYMTTYYVQFNRPVFDVMLFYLLWKASGRRLEWDRASVAPLELNPAGSARAEAQIRRFVKEGKLTGAQKDEVLAELAARLGLDYEALRGQRIMHLMRPEEVSRWAEEGADIQLHTHRHRVSRNKETFRDQIVRNAELLQSMTNRRSLHFCYPSGTYLPEFPSWLREYGLQSATTCDIGLASRHDDPMLLPRVMDTSTLTQEELEGWLTGVSAWMPVRRYPFSHAQILENEAS